MPGLSLSKAPLIYLHPFMFRLNSPGDMGLNEHRKACLLPYLNCFCSGTLKQSKSMSAYTQSLLSFGVMYFPLGIYAETYGAALS